MASAMDLSKLLPAAVVARDVGSAAASNLELVVGDEVERFPKVHGDEFLIGVGKLCVRVALISDPPEEVESVVRIVGSLSADDVEICKLFEHLQIGRHLVPVHTLAKCVFVPSCFAQPARVDESGADFDDMSHRVTALWVNASQCCGIASAKDKGTLNRNRERAGSRTHLNSGLVRVR
jgi:hypothetical protein